MRSQVVTEMSHENIRAIVTQCVPLFLSCRSLCGTKVERYQPPFCCRHVNNQHGKLDFLRNKIGEHCRFFMIHEYCQFTVRQVTKKTTFLRVKSADFNALQKYFFREKNPS